MENKLTDYKQYPKIRCVYKITNITTNKIYIGSTFSLRDRMIRHLSYLKRNCHHSLKLQRAFNKYSINDFIVEIIYDCANVSDDDMHNKEVFFIKNFNSVEEGFNNIINSKHYKKFKQTTLSKEKAVNSKKIPVLGINIITKEKIEFDSLSSAARFVNDQSTNISKCCKGQLRFIKNFVFIYLKNFDNTKDYTILVNKKYNRNPDSLILRGKSNKLAIKVYKYDLEGNFIKEYHSRSFCENQNNLKKESLRTIIPNRTPTGGYIYLYNKNKI